MLIEHEVFGKLDALFGRIVQLSDQHGYTAEWRHIQSVVSTHVSRAGRSAWSVCEEFAKIFHQ